MDNNKHEITMKINIKNENMNICINIDSLVSYLKKEHSDKHYIEIEVINKMIKESLGEISLKYDDYYFDWDEEDYIKSVEEFELENMCRKDFIEYNELVKKYYPIKDDQSPFILEDIDECFQIMTNSSNCCALDFDYLDWDSYPIEIKMKADELFKKYF